MPNKQLSAKTTTEPSSSRGTNLSLSVCSLEFIAKGIVVAASEPAFLALVFSSPDEVFQTARTLGSWLATFGAAFIALHPQLIFALPRDRKMREFVNDRLFHITKCLPHPLAG